MNYGKIKRITFIVLMILINTVYIKIATAITLFADYSGVNEKKILMNLKASFKNQIALYDQPLSETSANALYQQQQKHMLQAIQPFGYFNVSVQSHLIKQDKTIWRAKFQINLGPPTRIDDIHLKLSGPGKNNLTLVTLIKQFPLKRNDIFQAQHYNEAKDLLFQTARAAGYFKATLTQNKILIDVKHNKASIFLSLDTGARYYFGPVHFTPSEYSDDFLNCFIHFDAQEPFSIDHLMHLQQAMESSHYFRQVSIIPQLDRSSASHHVPIHVTVFRMPHLQYNAGLGYGTLTGPRISSGLEIHYPQYNAQALSMNLKLSSILSNVVAKYTIPGMHPLSEQWTLAASYQKFQPKNGKSHSKNLSVGYLFKQNDWQTSIQLNYLLERYRIQNEPAENSELLYPNLTLNYVHTDDPVDPQHAILFHAFVQGTFQKTLSSTSFFQFLLKTKYIMSPSTSSHVLLRADFGYTLVKDLSALPLTMRFFAGGLNSIRGYADSSIGPGRYLKTMSAEYQHHLRDPWDGALFYDLGTASDQLRGKLEQGIGVGIIYKSMVGPIKLYFSRALSKNGKPYSIDFSVGPEL